jgi:hypothetical protein
MKNNQIIFYATPQGNIKVEVVFEEETFWLSQKRIADLFSVDVRTINGHLKNIYATGELQKDLTIRKFRIVQQEGEVAAIPACRQAGSFRSLSVPIVIGMRGFFALSTLVQYSIW